jgi:hypothetical protein
MRIIYRNLTDLDEIIRKFEEQYKIGSVEMLKDQSARAKISEDDLLKWEAYVTQRRRLLDHNAEIHREYLKTRRAASNKSTPAAYDPVKHAA